MLNRTATLILGLVVLSVALVSCGDDDDVSSPGDVYQSLIEEFQLSPLPAIPYPENNRFSAERVALGRLLFFDPILGGESAPWVKSANGRDPYRFRANDMACATCHLPQFGFADGRHLGAGVSGAQFSDLDLGPDRVVPGPSIVTGEPVGAEPRNSPSVLNTAFNGRDSIEPTAESFQFWDGRVTKGLEEQAVLPITSRDEMAGDGYDQGLGITAAAIQDSVTARVQNIPEYAERFKQAFPREITVAGDITLDHIARAIAAYERELITPNSRYDLFLEGNQEALSPVEKLGFEMFFTKGKCGDCHFGPMLSNFKFTVQGAGDAYDDIITGFAGKNGAGGDFGRFHADEVGLADQKFAFRTPTIRNVELTGPYFHSGSAGTLRETMEFYNRGGLGPDDFSDAELAAEGATRHESIVPLGLTDEEIDAIVAFMKTTTAPVQAGILGVDLAVTPNRVPSGLVPPGIPTPPGSGPFLPSPPRGIE